MVYLLELREKIREIYSNNKEYCRLLYKFLMLYIVFHVEHKIKIPPRKAVFFIISIIGIIGVI